MKLDQVKKTYIEFKELYVNMFKGEYNWELFESARFYKQSIRDFLCASRMFSVWLIGSLLCLFSFVFLPFAILWRVFKK